MHRRGLPFAVAGCVLAAALAGCEPRYRLVWSPDGTVAAVIAEDGLRFCDPNGKLGEVVAKDVEHIRWLGGPKAPNSSRELIGVQIEWLKTWKALLPHLTDNARERAIVDAEAILKELRNTPAPAAGKNIEIKTPSANRAASLLYLREGHDKELADKFGGQWAALKGPGFPLRVIRLFQRREGFTGLEGMALTKTPREVGEIRPSPDGMAYAFAAAGDPLLGEDSYCLFAAPLGEDATPQRLAEDVALWFDWSPDGRDLLYATETQRGPKGDAPRPTSLRRQTVRAANGGLLPAPGPARKLAWMNFDHNIHIRTLPDGSILFAAGGATLSAEKVSKENMALYRLDPNGAKMHTVVGPRGGGGIADANGVAAFEPSPDGKMVTVPSGSFQIAVLDLATGKATMVQPVEHATGPGGEIPAIVPVWRTNKELCLSSPRGEKDPNQAGRIVLWSREGGVKVLSGDWPVQAVGGEDGGWLAPPRKRPTPQATKPVAP